MVMDSIESRIDEGELVFARNVVSSYTAQIPTISRRSTIVVRRNLGMKRQIANLSSSKAEFQPPKLHTALLLSQDGSQGVVEYAL
jgi:hypothetical protein